MRTGHTPGTQHTRHTARHVHIGGHVRVWVAAMRVFEHYEACPAPCGGETVTRSMRRVANATLLQFDRYAEPPDSRSQTHRDARSDHGYL